MPHVNLTQGYVTSVDAASYEKVARYRWCALVVGRYTKLVYAVRNTHHPDGRPRTQLMHRLLLGIDDAPLLQCDHIDGDTLNNYLNNLRVVTNKQNSENRGGAYRTSTTGVRGVSYTPKGRFRVRITDNYVNYYVGTYDIIEEAKQAAIDARREMFTHSSREET